MPTKYIYAGLSVLPFHRLSEPIPVSDKDVFWPLHCSAGLWTRYLRNLCYIQVWKFPETDSQTLTTLMT